MSSEIACSKSTCKMAGVRQPPSASQRGEFKTHVLSTTYGLVFGAENVEIAAAARHAKQSLASLGAHPLACFFLCEPEDILL